MDFGVCRTRCSWRERLWHHTTLPRMEQTYATLHIFNPILRTGIDTKGPTRLCSCRLHMLLSARAASPLRTVLARQSCPPLCVRPIRISTDTGRQCLHENDCPRPKELRSLAEAL